MRTGLCQPNLVASETEGEPNQHPQQFRQGVESLQCLRRGQLLSAGKVSYCHYASHCLQTNLLLALCIKDEAILQMRFGFVTHSVELLRMLQRSLSLSSLSRKI